jgi:hypothetical protein
MIKQSIYLPLGKQKNITVPKYILQHLKLRETTYVAGKIGKKSIYLGLTCLLIKQVGKTSILVNSSFSELTLSF